MTLHSSKNNPYLKMLPMIIALAWPTMLEQLLQTAVQYIDTAMVGSLGTKATAAVGATSTVNWLISSTISALGVGFLAFISQSFGAGDKQKAKKASGQAVMTVIAAGLFFTILTVTLSSRIPVWMREKGYSKCRRTLFQNTVYAHAFSVCKHYFRHCSPLSGRYKNTYACRNRR